MSRDHLTARASIRIHKPPSAVFAAFADATAMSKFWFTRRDEGLEEGKPVTWYLVSGDKEYAFEVFVKELSHAKKIVIEWNNSGAKTQITWSMEETENGDTILSIDESGYTGSSEEIVERALDSTGGFNQVIVAAKALIEHGVELNVVADHV